MIARRNGLEVFRDCLTAFSKSGEATAFWSREPWLIFIPAEKAVLLAQCGRVASILKYSGRHRL